MTKLLHCNGRLPTSLLIACKSLGTLPKIGIGADHRNRNGTEFRLRRIGSFISAPIWAPDSDKDISDATHLGVNSDAGT